MRSYNSFLTTNNASQVIAIYRDYIKDPSLVDKSWHEFFKALAPEEISILADYQKINWSETSRDIDIDILLIRFLLIRQLLTLFDL